MTKDEAQAGLAAQREVEVGALYRHWKGGLYVVFAVSIDEGPLGQLVHYYSLEKKCRWTRTWFDFTGTVTGADDSPPRFIRVGRPTRGEISEAVGWVPEFIPTTASSEKRDGRSLRYRRTEEERRALGYCVAYDDTGNSCANLGRYETAEGRKVCYRHHRRRVSRHTGAPDCPCGCLLPQVQKR